MRNIVRLALASVALAVVIAPALAFHRWSIYHWPRPGPEITPPVGDNVSPVWDEFLSVAVNGANGPIDGWNDSKYIESPLVVGQTNPRNCKPKAGTIQVCDSSYGNNGWLGLAQIWVSSGGHITQGVSKLNNTYFNRPPYNTPAWRRLVMCQEIAHDYGLDHTDETFNNANDGTCMDYTNAPAGGIVNGFNYGPSNEYPYAHDFEEFETIYSHADATNFAVRVVGQAAPQAPVSEEAGGNSPAEWGRAIGFDGHGRPDRFEKQVAPGRKMITHVFWAMGEGPRGGRHSE